MGNRNVLGFDVGLGINNWGDVVGGHVPFDATILVDSDKWRKVGYLTESLEYIKRERRGVELMDSN